MRKSCAFLIFLGAMCSANAQIGPRTDALSTRPGWEAGIQAARYQYEEPDFAKLTGNRVGVSGVYTHIWRRVFLRTDARYSYGSLKYEGSGTTDGVPDSILEVRGVIGTDFRPAPAISLSPFAGLGYRYLYDDLRGYSTDGNTTYAGYRRYSQYAYVPIGLTARFATTGRRVLAPTVEYDVFILGRQRSALSDTGIAGLHDVTQDQRHGRGYRASFTIEGGHWAFGPWANYWKIEDSEVVDGFFEPANHTWEAGIEVRYRF